MQPYLETAIQWLHDTIRCHVRARREWNPPPPPGEWVMLCWDVGHSLSMMQAHGIPAEPVIEAVSRLLTAEFGSDGDLSPYGLRTMRQFYLDYFERPFLQAKLRSVSWDCHKLILALCRDPLQQEYYLDLCRAQDLTPEGLTQAVKEKRYELSSGPSAGQAKGRPPASRPKAEPARGRMSRRG
jgi:hypothetical protein